MTSHPPGGATFRSLREPNVRIYLASFIASGIGTWAQTTALILLVQSLGGEGLELGLITAFQFTPILLLGLWAGSIADRVDRYNFTIVLQAALGLQALLLGVLVLAGLKSIPALFGLTALGGVFAAFDNPTRRTFLTELVEPGDLANITSLATSAMTGSRMVGPLIGAALFATVGAGWAFLINAGSFGVMMIGLLRMDSSRFRPIARAERSASPIRDAVRAVWADPILRSTMLVFTVVSTFGFNTLVALPLVADELLGKGPEFFGYLLSAQSAGNIAGSLFVARQVNVKPMLSAFAGAGLAAGLVLGGLSRTPTITIGIVIGLGFASTMFVNSNTVLLQQRSSEQMRSRVLALSAVLFLGSTPIGGPITGIVGDHFGAAWSMMYGGLLSGAAVAIAIVLNLRRRAA